MTEINTTVIMVIAAFLGIVAGAGIAYASFNPAPTYCEQVESQVMANQSFNGTVACFEPGEVNGSLPAEIENRTDLRCVCRKEYRGNVQWFNIAFG